MFLLAVAYAQQHGPEQCERLSAWLAGHHDFADLEEAVLIAVDPPRRPVELEPLAILIRARHLARTRVPPSGESAFLLGEVEDDDLAQMVEAAMEHLTDP